MGIPENIKRLRESAELSQPALAKKAGVSQQLISQLENGKNLTTKYLPQIARALDVQMGQIDPAYRSAASPPAAGQVPLRGYIGAGGTVEALSFGDDETVDAPAESTPETIAAKVRGDSMYPLLRDGWLIYWSQLLPPDAMLNDIVVVQLEDERIMVKTIMRGSAEGLWNLISVNPNNPPLLDQVVRWIAPIDWIRPR